MPVGELDKTIPILVNSPWLVNIDLTFQKKNGIILFRTE